jgi:hypothetical protein
VHYWNGIVPTTADTIDEVTKTFSIALELFGYNNNIDNNNAYCGNDHSCFGY